jgi:membrane-associated HD superfamily phosphohydrolase
VRTCGADGLFVPGTDVTVKKGEVIVREGERINADHLSRIAVYNTLERREVFAVTKFAAVFILLFLLIAILFEYSEKNIKKFYLRRRTLSSVPFSPSFAWPW